MPKTIITHALRREYGLGQLLECNANVDPILQFKNWLKEAIDFPVQLPDAMVVATTTQEDYPDARVVLLKELSENGLTFFTNYNSPKGQQLKRVPFATCVFWWPEMERQIRIRGPVKQVDQETSDAYFKSRPTESKLAAHASPQSEVIPDRDWLISNFERVSQNFENHEITRPPNWGGYLLTPISFEFWQGRHNRLHDRLFYEKDFKYNWILKRLAP